MIGVEDAIRAPLGSAAAVWGLVVNLETSDECGTVQLCVEGVNYFAMSSIARDIVHGHVSICSGQYVYL
jgi:hypothetical protein